MSDCQRCHYRLAHCGGKAGCIYYTPLWIKYLAAALITCAVLLAGLGALTHYHGVFSWR